MFESKKNNDANALPATLPPGRKKVPIRTNVEKWALEIGRIYRKVKAGKLSPRDGTKMAYIARQAVDAWEKAEQIKYVAELSEKLDGLKK